MESRLLFIGVASHGIPDLCLYCSGLMECLTFVYQSDPHRIPDFVYCSGLMESLTFVYIVVASWGP